MLKPEISKVYLPRFEKGIPVDQLDHRGMTPLACAASSTLACEDVVKLLIESGADVNLAVEDGKKTPIVAGCLYG